MSSSSMPLTCTTAPGHVFSDRTELANHYKSDWHTYNLKRRQAGLKVLTHVEFSARLQAAQAARREQDLMKQTQKQSHLKRRTDKDKKKQPPPRIESSDAPTTLTSAAPDSTTDSLAQEKVAPMSNEQEEDMDVEEEETPTKITIDPCQSLYDSHTSPSIHANVDYMRQHYSWFLPDADYLVDLEGLLGYCHEKISVGHICLQCHQVFGSAVATRGHMRSKQHTQLAYLTQDDQEELAVFFDFSSANDEFLGTAASDKKTMKMDEDKSTGSADEVDGWEDVSDDEDMEDDDEEDLFAGYADHVANMGFSVTALGELVFPDGRIVGHRSLRRYYAQRPKTHRTSTAVAAARLASGERLYQGRVYNMNTTLTTVRNGGASNNALTLARLGIAPGLTAGRSGKGILVPSGPEGSFSQLSVYRYRAAVQKHRRGEQRGQRLYNKTNQNMNHMDKKHNRIMTGVSVAHAKR